jgi:hypothetical protein
MKQLCFPLCYNGLQDSFDSLCFDPVIVQPRMDLQAGYDVIRRCSRKKDLSTFIEHLIHHTRTSFIDF